MTTLYDILTAAELGDLCIIDPFLVNQCDKLPIQDMTVKQLNQIALILYKHEYPDKENVEVDCDLVAFAWKVIFARCCYLELPIFE